MITDILFDFFGTLVQYTPGAFHSAPYQRTHQFLHEHGFQIAYDPFVEIFTEVSDSLEAQAKRTFHEYHMHDVGRSFFQRAFAAEVGDRVLVPFIAHFIDEWSRGIVYMDGLAPLLKHLTATYRLSIISNTHYPALIPTHLAAMDVESSFAQVITSVECGIRKPHPAIFEQALTALQITPQQAIYVGDTFVDDYQGATAAGMRCILLDPQQRSPDVPERIATVLDLADYLEHHQ